MRCVDGWWLSGENRLYGEILLPSRSLLMLYLAVDDSMAGKYILRLNSGLLSSAGHQLPHVLHCLPAHAQGWRPTIARLLAHIPHVFHGHFP